MRAPVLVAILAVAAPAACAATPIHGRYVEARTASVFAGPCHYEGEVVTRGRDAVLAWHVDEGRFRGATVMAVVTSDANLGQGAPRQSVVIVDRQLSPGEADALVAALRGPYAAALGHIVAVRHAVVRFTEHAGDFEVTSPGTATIATRALPDRACCKMKALVWYAPLAAIQDARVGFTRRAESSGAGRFTPWTDAGENTAFYGRF